MVLHHNGVERGADQQVVEHVDVDIRPNDTLLDAPPHQTGEPADGLFVQQLLRPNVQRGIAFAFGEDAEDSRGHHGLAPEFERAPHERSQIGAEVVGAREDVVGPGGVAERGVEHHMRLGRPAAVDGRPADAGLLRDGVDRQLVVPVASQQGAGGAHDRLLGPRVAGTSAAWFRRHGEYRYICVM